ncbi:Mu-like prophage major head subunit gpT family protein [Pseudoalteromonas rhizosphaerae]|uniref:Mu-like prophage major head subunit gpT family protein n=1 Tax=Pseudoalteromonas rhizosphaerae TaxID=2518973 RepID=UPI0021473D22|nr:Mu-like prophage major head subunit gpT family protein [Pseudoalteromonas rhizosphaerae]
MTTGTNLKEASTAFASRFDKGLSHNEEPFYIKVATVVPSKSSSTGYGFLGQIPAIQEWVGDRQLAKLNEYEYEIKNKLFETSIAVKRTDFEDNDYGKYGILFEDLGREASEFPDDHVFALLKDGHTRLCLDGQNFFDTDHTIGEQVNISNYDYPTDPAQVFEAWYLLDTTRVLKPFLWQERIKPAIQNTVDDSDSHVFLKDEYLYGIRARGNAGYGFWQLASKSNESLTPENFNKVYQRMLGLKGDSGRTLRIKPNVLVVPPSLRQLAHDVVKKERLANGESNINFDSVEILVCPYL